ncbi:MAG: RDD family protein [Acidobacteriota bacterium]
MNCPVCNRTLAPTLSICLTCGTMMNDSVREELQTKIGAGMGRPNVQPPTVDEASRPEKPPIQNPRPIRTTELNRQKTSPTLVGFQPKNPTVPDWRLQLQNAVRHRNAGGSDIGDARQTKLVTSGSNALKAEYIEEAEEQAEATHSDPRVAAALNRIDKSRKTFLPEPAAASSQLKDPEPRNYPFNVVSRNGAAAAPAREAKASVNVPPKPRLVPTITLKKGGYDTNKLPPVPTAEPINSFDMPVPIPAYDEPIAKPAIKVNLQEAEIIQVVHSEEIEETATLEQSEEFDDLAPFAMRFNAGLFDLIIGLFTSLLFLSPIAFAGGNWMSGAGFLTLAGTCSIVMFVYLTLSIAIFGRTAGMKLFSLELVDADLNEYPTFHQAAVNSAVYLLTLPFAGIGFLTMFFNDEKRAAHDLLSGTIIVTEF